MFHQLLNVVVALAIITDSLALPTCACGAVESEGANSATASSTRSNCCGHQCRACCRRAKSSTAGKSAFSTAARERKSCCLAPEKRSQGTRQAPSVMADAAHCSCCATNPASVLVTETMSKPMQPGTSTCVAPCDARLSPQSCGNLGIETAVKKHRPTALQRCVELRRLLI